MSERQSAGQNPTAIWQAAWKDKIDIILLDLRNYDHIMAWTDLIDMKTILPPECETDTNDLFAETEKIIFKKIITTTVQYYATKIREQYRDTVVIPTERKLLSAIKDSLYKRGWINKPDFSAQPKFERKGHL